MDEDRITLKAYSGIWKVERRLEHLNGIRTASIPFENAIYVLGGYVLEFLLCTMIPPLRNINIIVYILLPFGFSIFFKKIKLEGKNPLSYLLSVIQYALESKVYVRFRAYKEDRNIQFNSKIVYRKDYVEAKKCS